MRQGKASCQKSVLVKVLNIKQKGNDLLLKFSIKKDMRPDEDSDLGR